MKVNSSLKSMSNILEETCVIEVNYKSRESKAKASGVKQGAKLCLRLIENENQSKESITKEISHKINNSIYNLFLWENELSSRNLDSIKLKILFHESLINTLQLIQCKLINVK